jgi:predicted acylesterase/phospholipase RssA
MTTTKRKQSTRKSPKSGKKKAIPFKRRYSRLIRSLSQEDTKVVLSLGGGGIRMYAHIPVISFLEKLGTRDIISEIWGASGGAIIGLYCSMGIPTNDMVKLAHEMASPKTDLQLTPSTFSIIRNIVTDFLFAQSSKRNLEGFVDIQKSLRKIIHKDLHKSEAKHPFYCLAYNMKENKTDVLCAQPVPEGLYSNFIFETNPLDAVIASSSIPILFIPKLISDKNGRRHYVDGATNEEIPTVSIYKKWLRDKEVGIEKRKRLLVISVDLNPNLSTVGILGNRLIQKLPAFRYFMMIVRLSDLMRIARIKEQKRVLVNDPNIELWEIKFPLSGIGLMNIDAIPDVIRKAEISTPKQFAKINDSLLS